MPRGVAKSLPRSRSRSPGHISLRAIGVDEISEEDYFLKNTEFREWLKSEKNKFFDQLDGEKARHYFRKFVKAWNRGLLSESLYRGVDSTSKPSSSQTGYQWSFASNRSKIDKTALQEARESVAAATSSSGSLASTGINGFQNRVSGPSMPSGSDLQLLREEQALAKSSERRENRKRDRLEEKGHLEDLVGPKEIGREGRLENKRVKREADRQFRERSPEGEVNDGFLMGGGDSFKARLAQRDAARKRSEEKKQLVRTDQATGSQERLNAMKERERQTMEMFAKMAKERYG